MVHVPLVTTYSNAETRFSLMHNFRSYQRNFLFLYLKFKFNTPNFIILQGFFDEDSMDEFIASETEESSMSLTSEDEKMKK